MVGRSVAKFITEAYSLSSGKIPGFKFRSLSTFNLSNSRRNSVDRSLRLSKSSHNIQHGPGSHVSKREAHRFETARSFGKPKIQQQEEEMEEENVFEISDRSNATEPVYDVFNFIRKSEHHKALRGFAHLQPSNLRPFGSACQHYPNIDDTRPRIIYPIVTDPKAANPPKYEPPPPPEKYSSAFVQKEYPGYGDDRKVVVYENNASKAELVTRKHYSTHCLRKKPQKPSFPTKPGKPHGNLRSKSTLSLKKVQEQHRQISKMVAKQDFNAKVSEVFLNNIPKSHLVSPRSINTSSAQSKNLPIEEANVRNYSPGPLCDQGTGFKIVGLNNLKTDGPKQKVCKPKPIKFGKLPKLIPPDCPCIEDIPLKEGKPLLRLNKRPIPPPPPRECPEIIDCTTPRADDNYKIVPKTLPQIKMYDCPCTEQKLVDFKFKRLPKCKVPEPVRVCPAEVECEDAVRADDNLLIEKKVLPKLIPGECPCIEPVKLKDMPLTRLKPKKVSFRRLCLEPKECPIPRADDGLKIKPKKLKPIKPLCQCVEPPPLIDVPPLKRLCPLKFVEKPRKCRPKECDVIVRADDPLKIEKKKLPAFKPQNCPCIEAEIPDKMVELKRLKKRNNPKAPPNECKDPLQCTTPRADDGMKIKPKKLKQIKEVDCPCEPIVMKDIKPLKRLCPKPVKEPKRVVPCLISDCAPRSDENMKIKKKTLPVLPPGSCPCIEPEPVKDVPPLVKLKKRKVKPPPPCPPEPLVCVIPRADDGMKVKQKQLPKYQPADCPCIEATPPEDVKPLKRLKKVDIPEPPKVCPKIDDCEETPRADCDDWMYWKRCEVPKEPECPPNSSKPAKKPKGKRSFSTLASTRSKILGYKAMNLSKPKGRAYSMYAEMKQSSCLDDSVNSAILLEETKKTSATLNDSKVLLGLDSWDEMCNTRLVRFFSTSNIRQHAASNLKEKDCPCGSPVEEDYLQPKNQKSSPMIEKFMIYPEDKQIELAASRSRKYCRETPDALLDECPERDENVCEEEEGAEKACLQEVECEEKEEEKPPLSLWERIVNYFKARPNCPSPEEFRKMRLREDAEKAAAKAGLCLYDPKELLKKNEKDLPKIITGKQLCKK